MKHKKYPFFDQKIKIILNFTIKKILKYIKVFKIIHGSFQHFKQNKKILQLLKKIKPTNRNILTYFKKYYKKSKKY